jgi:histidine ammonia-lyase
MVAEGKAVYGSNTGFGKLANTHIADGELELLQRNLVLSHSVGVGALLPDDVVRLVMLLKVASLARGYSGVRPEVVDAILALLNAGVHPCIPSKGSVGASGVAPLAHMSAVLLGLGKRCDGRSFRGGGLKRRNIGAAIGPGGSPSSTAPKSHGACVAGSSRQKTCSRRRSCRARYPWTPPWAATRRSTNASIPFAVIEARSIRLPRIASS